MSHYHEKILLMSFSNFCTIPPSIFFFFSFIVVQHLTKKIQVCKKTFRNTLGLQTDGLITELCKKIKSDIVGQNVCENPGKRAPQNKVSIAIREKATSHINSLKPSTPHFQRKNAPIVKYLPCSLTIDN